MADIAESFQIGFGVGLGMVRNFQETADLMRKREMEKQADALQAQLAKEEAEFTKNATLANAKHESMTRDREAGLPVDEAELKRAEIDLRSMAVDRTKMYARFADRMMASGNPIAVERGQGFLKASMDMASQLQETWNMERDLAARSAAQNDQQEFEGNQAEEDRKFRAEQANQQRSFEAGEGRLNRQSDMARTKMQLGTQERIAGADRDATKKSASLQAKIGLLEYAAQVEKPWEDEQLQALAKENGLSPFEAPDAQFKVDEATAAKIASLEEDIQTIDAMEEEGEADKSDIRMREEYKKEITRLKKQSVRDRYRAMKDDRSILDRAVGVAHPLERLEGEDISSSRKKAADQYVNYDQDSTEEGAQGAKKMLELLEAGGREMLKPRPTHHGLGTFEEMLAQSSKSKRK